MKQLLIRKICLLYKYQTIFYHRCMPYRILIVEDDLFIRELYQNTLAREGYTIDTAADGEIAIQKATTTPYDLILLDIMLPKYSGIDVLRKIRNSAPETKHTSVILTTNLSEENVIKDAVRMGIDGYLLKAELSPEEVVREINAFFEKKATTIVQ